MRKTKYGTDSQSHIIDLFSVMATLMCSIFFIQKRIQTVNTDYIHNKPPFKVHTFFKCKYLHFIILL